MEISFKIGEAVRCKVTGWIGRISTIPHSTSFLCNYLIIGKSKRWVHKNSISKLSPLEKLIYET